MAFRVRVLDEQPTEGYKARLSQQHCTSGALRLPQRCRSYPQSVIEDLYVQGVPIRFYIVTSQDNLHLSHQIFPTAIRYLINGLIQKPFLYIR